jgi:hypothetical protein
MLPPYLDRPENPFEPQAVVCQHRAHLCGIFLWIAFYNQLAGTTLKQEHRSLLAGLVAAAAQLRPLYKIPACWA